MFFTLIFGNNFSYSILENCVSDESCTEKFAPISPKSPKFVAQIDICVHRLSIYTKRNSAKIFKSFIDR